MRRRPGWTRRPRGRRSRRPARPPPPASGTAARCRRRSRGRRRPWRSTLAPRSWPSWPILATSMRGRRPSLAGEVVDSPRGSRSKPASPSQCRRRRRRDDRRMSARWRPHTFSRADGDLADGGTSPSGSMASASRLPSPVAAASVRASQRGRDRGLVARRPHLRQPRDLPLAHRGVVDRPASRPARPRSGRYLFTPTTTSSPASTRAWRSAALPRCAAWACPASTALVMPPSASTSSISSQARSPALRSAPRRK